jgi:uncharacterized protein (DUF302 family)
MMPVERTTAALKQEGFGIITAIDVKDTAEEEAQHRFPRLSNLGRLQFNPRYNAPL